MASEIDQAQTVSDVLDQGDVSIGAANQSLHKYDGEVQASKGLLKEFSAKDRRERIYLILSLTFFISVVCFIAYQRLGIRFLHLAGLL